MAIPRLFKSPDPKKFNYSPLYWNEEKEAREQRNRTIEQEMGVNVKSSLKSSTITRGSFRISVSKTRSKANRKSNGRVILIILVLLLLAYIFLLR